MNTATKKSWIEVKEKLTPDPEKMDAKGEKKAIDAMIAEREKATAFSSADRNWEKDRKQEWNANKKYYLKDQQSKIKDPLKELIRDVKNGGSYQTAVHPLAGYILTRLEKPERKTEAGIILPDNSNDTPNTARVLEVGRGYWVFNDHFEEPQVKAGQMVIFRKMAGMDVEVKGEKLYMLHATDLIAIVD